jgi:protein-tyrosine-phosphatase
VLLPLDDAALWLCGRAARGAPWTLAGAEGAALELALDKSRQIASACAAGFDVPPTVVARSTDEALDAGLAFPLIVRSAEAVRLDGPALRKGRNWICADAAEFARSRGAWASRQAVLLQPFLEGVGEGIFGLATDQGVVAWSAHRRLRMMNPHGSGSSACAAREVDESLKGPVTRFLASVGWRGMFMIELLRTCDGRAWFIEFNGRAWGSMALARRQALEYPAWTVHRSLDPRCQVTTAAPAREGLVCRHLGRELMHLLFVLRGPRSKAIRNWPGVGATLRSLLHVDGRSRLYNWRTDDWRVFLADAVLTVVRNLSKGSGAPARKVLLIGAAPGVQLEVCRSLGRAGYRVSILRLQPGRSVADASRYCAESVYIGRPDASATAYEQRLADFLRAAGFDHVLPLDATALALLDGDPSAAAASSRIVRPALAHCRDAANRRSALARVEAAGLRTLDTLTLERGAERLPPMPRLPCMVRPAQACAMVDDAPALLSSRRVDTLRALDAKLRDDLPRVDVLLQPLPDGVRTEVALCAVAGRMVAHAATVCVDRGGARSRLARPDAAVRELAERVVRQLHWTGFMVIELCRRENDDAPTFVDLQLGAARSLRTLRRSGIDLPRGLFEALDGAAPAGKPWRRVDAIDDPAPMLQGLCSSAGMLLHKAALRLRSMWFWRSGLASTACRLSPSQSVLLVCKGNINRSMVAEQVLRRHGFARVASAGLAGMAGRRPSAAAERFIRERLGIDASGLRSQSVPRALACVGHADIVVCFERRHVVELVQRHPELRGKVVLLTGLTAERRPADIEDPHNQPDRVYDLCFERIERLLGQAVERRPARIDERSMVVSAATRSRS